MQSSSLNANQALSRILIDTCADDGMPARDTIGMYVSGRRGSLLPTGNVNFTGNLHIITREALASIELGLHYSKKSRKQLLWNVKNTRSSHVRMECERH